MIKNDIIFDIDTETGQGYEKIARRKNPLLYTKMDSLKELQKLNRRAFRNQRKKRFDKDIYDDGDSSSDDEAYDEWG